MNDIGLARNMDNDEKAFPKKLEEVIQSHFSDFLQT